jgi:hypothetical protein
MTHLSPADFVDLLDGSAAASRWGHLKACAACQQQFEALQDTADLAASVEVPEPPPFFWDYFSERVRTGTAGIGGPAPFATRWWRVLAPSALVAAALLVVVLVPRGGPESTVSSVGPVQRAPILSAPSHGDDDYAEDPHWQLVSSLSSSTAWDEAPETTLGMQSGVGDRALVALADDERGELAVLLKTQLKRPES